MDKHIRIDVSAESHGSITGAPNGIVQSDTITVTRAEFEAVKADLERITRMSQYHDSQTVRITLSAAKVLAGNCLEILTKHGETK